MRRLHETAPSHWQDGGIFLLGVWLFASPWVLEFTAVRSAHHNAALLGVVVAVMAAWSVVAYRSWEAWATVAVGGWLVATPWLFGFATLHAGPSAMAAFAATWDFIGTGMLVGGLAGWSSFDMRDGGRLSA